MADIQFTPPEANKDDLYEAIRSLNRFTKNWCMNVEETEENNDLTFRCAECLFSGKNIPGITKEHCLIKTFAYTMDSEFAENIGFGAMGSL